ncbi:phosphogluconate dehydrogenase (NAD(+)-dependent, decarboxylating) [Desulfohalovibrio reitneri]|uniref:phosphogluconate dehydrogenase (NAD(+)-dependent, decarboxylating) n=1 Tax=Desulfohalovibrio reitneri TaxID=1307759 RepID=UPI0004A6F539|nr:decarboxylating 6-phosphogluconate dehydrogenase [Desulfohalovibrio reitneri]
MKLAMIGLGRMGYNMAARLARGGHEVVAYNRTFEKARELADAEKGVTPVETLEDTVAELDTPRVIWMMLPAGEVVDENVDALLPMLSKGDLLVDGGNSWYKDAPLRAAQAGERGVGFMDVGTSGGVWGLTEGYCLMAGGTRDDFRLLEPALRVLAPERGYIHCGGPGAGHFVKMVHNGIEYGMMQAYAEGFAIMEDSEYAAGIDYSTLSETWNHGSVIRSWLLELARDAFREDPGLDSIKGWVEDSGEGRWTVQQAVESGTPAPVITLSLMERFRSRRENAFADRVLAALRHAFGGHAVKR